MAQRGGGPRPRALAERAADLRVSDGGERGPGPGPGPRLGSGSGSGSCPCPEGSPGRVGLPARRGAGRGEGPCVGLGSPGEFRWAVGVPGGVWGCVSGRRGEVGSLWGP